jgi:hypothetical protein
MALWPNANGVPGTLCTIHSNLLSPWGHTLEKIRHVVWDRYGGSLVAALNSHTHTTWLRYWGSGSLGGVKMMPLCHGWGWKPPQTVSPIHLSRHIQSVWAHWYAVHRHTVAALHSHTHTTWLRFWALGHLWSWYVVITSQLRIAATSNCSPHPS